MEFGLSQDQLLLDDSVRKYLSSEVSIDVVRKIASVSNLIALFGRSRRNGFGRHHHSRSPWWCRAGMLDAVAIAEALGYAACPGPFLSTAIMSAHLLNQAGATDPLRDGKWRLPSRYCLW